jgi:cell wall-associated NlpC family hydrolase
MTVTRKEFVERVRRFSGARFSHQGRSRANGFDCGGLVLVAGREIGLSELEFLGYASFPTEGKFEELLAGHTEFLGFEWSFPFSFDGTELLAGDLLSFDYGNGEGTRHLALVTGWRKNCYWVLDAIPERGVSEHPLRFPFVKQNTRLKGWRVAGLTD